MYSGILSDILADMISNILSDIQRTGNLAVGFGSIGFRSFGAQRAGKLAIGFGSVGAEAQRAGWQAGNYVAVCG